MNNHLCPVCGYEMTDEPANFNTCPSCGTEFGLHDVSASIEELRQAWIESGPRWWSTANPQPANWDPFRQLAGLGLASGSVVSTTGVVKITATANNSTSLTGGWLGSVEQQPWGQFVSRQPSSV